MYSTEDQSWDTLIINCRLTFIRQLANSLFDQLFRVILQEVSTVCKSGQKINDHKFKAQLETALQSSVKPKWLLKCLLLFFFLLFRRKWVWKMYSAFNQIKGMSVFVFLSFSGLSSTCQLLSKLTVEQATDRQWAVSCGIEEWGPHQHLNKLKWHPQVCLHAV